MSVAWKLALSYAVRHPARMLLTSLAMIASACIVVWVVSSYDAMAMQFGKQASTYLGRYDFFIVPEDPNNPSVDEKLVESLRKDPAVAEATPVIQVRILRLVNPNAGPEDMGGGPGGPGGRGQGPGVKGQGPGAKGQGPGARGQMKQRGEERGERGEKGESPNRQISKSPNPMGPRGLAR
jgi:hypothetical protein